jgi:WD repeat-containing protein 35
MYLSFTQKLIESCWAEDNSEALAVMEKTKLVIINHETAEEPITANGYLCRFHDFEVKSVNLDDLLVAPDDPKREQIVIYETKLLRDMRERIATGGLVAGQAFANKNAHPRIWRLLGDAALEELDFNIAEKAFVRREDYYAIQLVKRLKSMPDKMKARAEVAIHLKR